MPKKELYQHYPRSSSFYAYSNCDISFELMQAAGEEPPTPFSDRGTDVHNVLSGKLDPKLVDDATADLAAELNAEDVGLATRLYSKKDLNEDRCEERLWLHDGILMIYSGQPDRWRLYGDRKNVYLVDYKSGWHPFDHYVATNCQIRSYVPLLDELYDWKLEKVTAAMHKPGKKTPPAVFDRAEIDRARAWALDVADRVTRPGPKSANRGPWCKYCSGKVLCPAWRGELDQLAERAEASIGDIPDIVLREMAPRLELAKTVVEKLIGRLEARVKERPDLFPDWHFAAGDPRRQIQKANNPKAFDILVTREAALTFEEFIRSSKLAITDLEEFIRVNKKLGRKFVGLYLDEKLTGIIEKSVPKEHLVYDPVHGQQGPRLETAQGGATAAQTKETRLERQEPPDLLQLIEENQRQHA